MILLRGRAGPALLRTTQGTPGSSLAMFGKNSGPSTFMPANAA